MTQQLIAASIEHWKRKLLDLSKRNRLLNFKPNKVSTITVVDELPAEVFRVLVTRGQGMRFRPSDHPEGEPDIGDTGEDEQLQPFELSGTPDDSAPGERHTDTWLQTRLADAKLDHNLRRITDQAKSVLEEQGVNTLFLVLGMLHWYEADDSETLLKAPLLMVPVKLDRKAAGKPYVLSAGDDDPVLNPALAESLRSSFGVKLPELPELTDNFDAAPLYRAISQAIKDRKRWQVTNEIVLGLFSFQKFVMFKDLEKNKDAYAAHRLIGQLATRKGSGGFSLPPDVASMELDAEFPPEETSQVVDADSSQLRAVAAVGRGHDLVMQGPPGTGKSQTITNLIAHALGSGKTVLFVSEKMAALQVVYGRLKAAGLGDFCLELHSGKANKRAFISEIGRALDNSFTSPARHLEGAERLRLVRHSLTEYAAAVHTPEMPLGRSPFEAYGDLALLADSIPIRLRQGVESVTADAFAEAKRHLDDLAGASAPIGDPRSHPWRDTTKTYYSADQQEDIGTTIDTLLSECDAFIALAPQVASELGLPMISTIEHSERASAVAEILERSPGAALDVLQSDAWNSPPPQAKVLIGLGRRASEGKSETLKRFIAAVLDKVQTGDAELIEAHHRKLFRMLRSDYRRARKAWLQYRLPNYAGTLGDQVAHMRAADQTRRDLTELASAETGARDLFGDLWKGENSEWDALERYVDWVVEFRTACVRHGLTAEAAQRAAKPLPDVASARALAGHAKAVRDGIRALGLMIGWPADYLSNETVDEISERAFALRGAFERHREWASFYKARQIAAAGVARDALEVAEATGVAYGDLPRAFQRAFLQRWLDDVVQKRPALVEFHALEHEQRIAEFRALDRGALEANRVSLQARQRAAVQDRLKYLRDDESMGYLRGEMARQRNHAPVRRTLHKAHEPIKAIKPCFMMSPLTVAQFLDPSEHIFDLVVFDEASQLTAEDAVGAVVRGKQLVVVGDQKQLPPTNFFAVQSGQLEAEKGADGEPIVEDMESILEQFMAAGLSMARLRWHYRSKHESLIAFSNISFYDAELYTFPSADTDTRERGLQFVHVTDGLYEGAGLNRAEARSVADAVVEFAREQLAKADERERLTLGVGTFNLRQQIAIQDEIEARRRQEPSLEPFFAPRDDGAFFVKNLENIQGDDRDVIFLSVTYAKGLDGRLRHNFGPINGENGWRRLNVLITRAKLRMKVFSSMWCDDIDLSKTQAAGARYLKDFLQFAERGSLIGATVTADAETESPFERGILQELTRRGMRVVPQVGVAGYRVDLGVLDDEVEGRFICGIECDGAAYHAAESARDRDRLRQQVLEGLGWTILRVWSTDWFKDRDGTVQRLVERIEVTRRHARASSRPSRSQEVPGQRPAETIGDPAPVEWVDVNDAETTQPVSGEEYRYAQLASSNGRMGVMYATLASLVTDIGEVVRIESPVHQDDVMTRLAEANGDQRVGPRIAQQLERALASAASRSIVKRRGEFVYWPEDPIPVRSRAGTDIPADRIAPEEYQAAVLLVLRSTDACRRDRLTNAVRTVLGFNRTGRKLEERIGQAVESLIEAGQVGEGSTGLRIREH